MSANLAEGVARLAGKTVLVMGDVMLDEYITGAATRMSREAPIPVLEMQTRRYIAGGAANPIRHHCRAGQPRAASWSGWRRRYRASVCAIYCVEAASTRRESSLAPVARPQSKRASWRRWACASRSKSRESTR